MREAQRYLSHYLSHFGEHFSTESEDTSRLVEGLLHDVALAGIFSHHVDVSASEHNRVRHLRAKQHLARAECMHAQYCRAAPLMYKVAQVRSIWYLAHVLALDVPAMHLLAPGDACVRC